MRSARDAGFVDGLRARIAGELRERESLARYSTYRIGGPATVLLPRSPEDVGAALRFAADGGVPWFARGLGSNLLLPDEGMDALVIRIGKGLDRLEALGGGGWLGAKLLDEGWTRADAGLRVGRKRSALGGSLVRRGALGPARRRPFDGAAAP